MSVVHGSSFSKLKTRGRFILFFCVIFYICLVPCLWNDIDVGDNTDEQVEVSLLPQDIVAVIVSITVYSSEMALVL